MRYFPIFLDLKGQQVLVVGGGSVAERKIRLLLSAGAKVSVVARELSENVEAWQQSGEIEVPGHEYRPSAIEGKRLVFAATDDPVLNRRVFRDAERSNVPVNVVDDSAHCRFISPAVVDRSPVQVAVSTGGTSPVLARRIRGWIEKLLPMGIGNVALAAGSVRRRVRDAMPPHARRRFWETALSDPNLQRWSVSGGKRVRRELEQAVQQGLAAPSPGKVYLVGAGPGRMDLLTLRALNVLGQADVVLHDRLVPDEILDLARRDADRIYVGKQAGNHHRTQQEIHRIMLAEAGRGRTVVRLKGGDAFIFGRGGEELAVLREAGIDYEVVPGVTAATGCAAYAGIPLTHRDHAQTLTFVTGHLAARKGPGSDDVDWAGIAGRGKTVVVYMGVGQAVPIRQALLDAGIGPDLPVALVIDGTRDSQRTLTGTVETLPALARQSPRGRPGLLIVGKVAELGDQLRWFETLETARTAA
jgi:uroporphyrin-III C-methyltransferase/precorrin-2 dehydrogenase/sirohydrochlorin ferrochelatase